MDKHAEFAELLHSTIINSNSSESDVLHALLPLQSWILRNVPNKLYHFSSCSQHALDNFSSNEIWGSTISNFNDPYECVPRYNLVELWDNIFSNINISNFQNLITKIKQGQIPIEITSAFTPEQAVAICQGLKEMPEEQLEKNCQLIPNLVYKLVDSKLLDFIQTFYKGFYATESQKYISCFCEDNTSSLMWGHYGDSHRGFCLEYDFTSILRPCSRSCEKVLGCNNLLLYPSIAPVVYSETRFDATSHLFTILQNELMQLMKQTGKLYYPDTLLVLKCLLTKSIEWSYEKEWRIFVNSTASSEQFGKICYLKPTALYIGAKTKPEKIDNLRKIAVRNGIPCFKMTLQYTNDKFVVSPVPFSP